MPDDTNQLALDEADTAAGYRTIIDEDEQLQPGDPNAATCSDDHDDADHEQFIGDDAPADDGGVAAAGAALDGGGH